MKILLTAHQFLPDYSSGTEVLTYEVARELIRLGNEVRIFTGWPSNPETELEAPKFDEFEYEGIHVYRVRPSSMAALTPALWMRAEFNNPITAATFGAVTAKWRPDVVHFFHLQRLSASVAMRCAEEGIASVYTVTDFWPICPLNQLRLPDGTTCEGPVEDSSNCVLHLAVRGRHASLAPLYKWFPTSLVAAVLKIAPVDEDGKHHRLGAARALQDRPEAMRRMLHTIDRVIAPTHFMARRLRDFGTPKETLRLIRYGIDLSPFAAVAPILGEDTLRIGFIGTLLEHKGAHVLLEAMRMIDRELQISLSLFGEEIASSDYAATLRELAGDDTRIRFCGSFERSALADVMSQIDILVVPSTWAENTPLVMLAAQASGRPVIGSDVAGISEIVSDGHNGFLFEPGNAGALAALLQRVVLEPARLREMGAHAVQPKEIRRYGQQLMDLYGEIREERLMHKRTIRLATA